MSGLARTDLTTSQKLQVAANALAGQGIYGVKTQLAEGFGISRPTVYRAEREAAALLEEHFDAGHAVKAVEVTADEAQIRRAVVALRVVAPNSIRGIEALLPILYPGVQLSYGTIQGITAEAESRAAGFNDEADLCGITAGALDEMFSQGDPVLGGVDLDSGFLFALALHENRGAEDWKAVLENGRKQGLDLKVVVKDAALGIANGVTKVFPEAEQRDDCFHALYAMGKVHNQLERSAYKAIDRESEAEHRLHRAIYRIEATDRETVQSQRQKLNGARIIAGKKIALHDNFERAARRAQEALELVDLERGTLRDPAWMQAEIEAAAEQMMVLPHTNCKKVGRYIKNRAPGLVLYAAEMKQRLVEAAQHAGQDEVALACVVWRLAQDLRCGRRPWRRHADYQHLLGAFALLQHRAGANADSILAQVDALWQQRHRASSAIEGFNAFLRPFLYVHKGVTQGFLELLRAYYNLRTRRWGRHKGTSAHALLCGEPVDDWLSLLGYPPAASLH